MTEGRRPRDLALLDALDRLERVSLNQTVWRAVRQGRDPLIGSAAAGRWDPGVFDVLYTAFERDGAIAELHFHLLRQPVFPSKVQFTVNEIEVRTSSTLRFADLNELNPLGVDIDDYAKILHARTQEIGDAAAFLGFDGIVAPSARWQCFKLVIFSDRIGPADIELKQSSVIDFASWRRSSQRR
jgi:hypothetical protein